MSDRFRGHIYVEGENQLQAFQTAALISGYAITIFPKGNDCYKIEFLKYEKEDT